MFPLDHLNRYVKSVDASVEFYHEALGYSLLRRGLKANGKAFAILSGKGHELFISEKEGLEPETLCNFRHIGYAVEGVAALLAACKAKGIVESERELIIKPYSRQFYIQDPDGFQIDLIEWTDKQGFYEQNP